MSEKPKPAIWDFQTQLKKGRKGERLLLKHWPHPVRKHDILTGPDFVDSTGRVIELKSDSYDMGKTPNFFLERWSDWGKKKPGGPWQALEKEVQTFVYLFVEARKVFIFEDLPALVAELDKLTEGMYSHSIPNRGWTTVGYKVPRESLKHLYREETWK